MFLITALVAFVAVAIHCYIFVLEAFWWSTPRGRAVFGTTETEAAHTRALAFNQGFYNLFLAAIAAIGAVLLLADRHAFGAALVYAGCGAMALAGIVLISSDRSKARPALVQLTPPLLAIAALTVALA